MPRHAGRADARAAADLAGRPTCDRPTPVEELAARVAHGAAHVRPAVPGRDRHHPARLDHRPAGAGRPGAAGGHRPGRRRGRGPGRVRRRGDAAAPLHPPGRRHAARVPPSAPAPRDAAWRPAPRASCVSARRGGQDLGDVLAGQRGLVVRAGVDRPGRPRRRRASSRTAGGRRAGRGRPAAGSPAAGWTRTPRPGRWR